MRKPRRHPFVREPRTLGDFKERQTAYKLVFSSPAGQMVLRDLMGFCRAGESTFHPDPRTHALLEGRREVFLRIQDHVELTTDQAVAVFGGMTLRPEEINPNVPDDDL